MTGDKLRFNSSLETKNLIKALVTEQKKLCGIHKACTIFVWKHYGVSKKRYA